MTCSSACFCITLHLNLVGVCWLSCQCCADGDGVCASMCQITRLAQWCACTVSFQTRWTHTFNAIQLTFDVTADVCMPEIGKMLHACMLSLIVALESNDSDLAGLAQQEIAQDLSPLIQQSIVSNSNLAVVTHVGFRQVYMIAPPMRSVPCFRCWTDSLVWALPALPNSEEMAMKIVLFADYTSRQQWSPVMPRVSTIMNTTCLCTQLAQKRWTDMVLLKSQGRIGC